jgi:hypothetical protein
LIAKLDECCLLLPGQPSRVLHLALVKGGTGEPELPTSGRNDRFRRHEFQPISTVRLTASQHSGQLFTLRL